MPRALCLRPRLWVALILLALVPLGRATGQTVWSGFDVAFTRPNDVDFTQPEYQDRITSNVWITRSVQGGIFNIAVEDFFSTVDGSPVGTLWATDINNPGKSISAANFANLSNFDPWIDAYGGTGSMALPAILTGRNAVLRIVNDVGTSTDDIYIDIQFTSWTSSALGGGFSYNRAAAPPGPVTTGDYNQDDVVDSADYVLWRDTYGQPAVPPGSGADGNVNGTIDDPDYDFWAAHYGETIPGSASAPTLNHVPEPAALVLLPGGLGLLATRPRSSFFGRGRVHFAGRMP